MPAVKQGRGKNVAFERMCDVMRPGTWTSETIDQIEDPVAAYIEASHAW